MSKRLYIGVKNGGTGELFRADAEPTQESHGHQYRYALGPYRTVGEALRAMSYQGIRYDAPPFHYQQFLDAS